MLRDSAYFGRPEPLRNPFAEPETVEACLPTLLCGGFLRIDPADHVLVILRPRALLIDDRRLIKAAELLALGQAKFLDTFLERTNIFGLSSGRVYTIMGEPS